MTLYARIQDYHNFKRHKLKRVYNKGGFQGHCRLPDPPLFLYRTGT